MKIEPGSIFCSDSVSPGELLEMVASGSVVPHRQDHLGRIWYGRPGAIHAVPSPESAIVADCLKDIFDAEADEETDEVGEADASEVNAGLCKNRTIFMGGPVSIHIP